MSGIKRFSDDELKAHRAAYAKRWRFKNKARWNAYNRQFRKENPERVRKYRESYLKKNPERVLELRRLSNLRRRKKIRLGNKLYYEKNKARLIRQKSKYELKRVAVDPGFKCKKMLRNRIVECVKLHRITKSKRTMELIGCDREFLVKWIESKFTDGMTWQNHGNKGWHIDHIKPCASFDLTNPEHQKQCFHYSNLQPLWAKDNQIKGKNVSTEAYI